MRSPSPPNSYCFSRKYFLVEPASLIPTVSVGKDAAESRPEKPRHAPGKPSERVGNQKHTASVGNITEGIHTSSVGNQNILLENLYFFSSKYHVEKVQRLELYRPERKVRDVKDDTAINRPDNRTPDSQSRDERASGQNDMKKFEKVLTSSVSMIY